MGIFYREKCRKNDFARSEKYACYAPVQLISNILHVN